jgi:hypothetical protein
MSRKRWLVLFVALAVVVSFAAYGLPYNKLSWLDKALAQTYGEEGTPDAIAPAGGIVGLVVKSCPVYWQPDLTASTPITVPAGKTFYVLGVDSTNTFYAFRIAFVPFDLWVTQDCFAPNPDPVWNSTPLPTTVVG